MMQLDRMRLGRLAKEMGFVRDTLEKACRYGIVGRSDRDICIKDGGIADKNGTARFV